MSHPTTKQKKTSDPETFSIFVRPGDPAASFVFLHQPEGEWVRVHRGYVVDRGPLKGWLSYSMNSQGSMSGYARPGDWR